MTRQCREILLYRGEEREIRVQPLAGCDQAVPDSVGGFSTGCRRGYRGIWELRADALYLVHIGWPHGEEDRNALGEMFPGHSGPVEATWFSGELTDDDVVIDPTTQEVVDYSQWTNLASPFLSFVLVFHRGKLILEVATDWKEHVTQTRLTAHVASLFPRLELEFLHAIDANVDDPIAKLVYADWLEERGDPRGPILRNETAAQAGKEIRLRLASEADGHELLHNGYVPPTDMLWFWRWLADIPDSTPEQRRRQEMRAWLSSQRSSET